MGQIKKATVIATGEKIKVYKLNGGRWHDYDSQGSFPPSAPKSGKREFSDHELKFES